MNYNEGQGHRYNSTSTCFTPLMG